MIMDTRENMEGRNVMIVEDFSTAVYLGLPLRNFQTRKIARCVPPSSRKPVRRRSM
jgi:hypothetical protein